MIFKLISSPVIPGIPPEDRTAVVIILAIWLGLNLTPNSEGTDIRRGKMAELAIPKVIEENTIVVILKFAYKIKRLITADKKREIDSIFIFLEAARLSEATTNLNMVLNPQKIEPKIVASLLSEISVTTEYDGIQPAKLC